MPEATLNTSSVEVDEDHMDVDDTTPNNDTKNLKDSANDNEKSNILVDTSKAKVAKKNLEESLSPPKYNKITCENDSESSSSSSSDTDSSSDSESSSDTSDENSENEILTRNRNTASLAPLTTEGTAKGGKQAFYQPNVSINLSRLNSHLICKLCSGYYREAFTVVECLHSFCRSCIYQHFAKGSTSCPVCSVNLAPNPRTLVLFDRTLQSIVDKIIPNLTEADSQAETHFYSEIGIKRKREFIERERAIEKQRNKILEDSSIGHSFHDMEVEAFITDGALLERNKRRQNSLLVTENRRRLETEIAFKLTPDLSILKTLMTNIGSKRTKKSKKGKKPKTLSMPVSTSSKLNLFLPLPSVFGWRKLHRIMNDDAETKVYYINISENDVSWDKPVVKTQSKQENLTDGSKTTKNEQNKPDSTSSNISQDEKNNSNVKDAKIPQYIEELHPGLLPPLMKPYLQTSPGLRVRHLKKYIAKKLGISEKTEKLSIYCRGEVLGLELSLDFISKTRWHDTDKHLTLHYRLADSPGCVVQSLS